MSINWCVNRYIEKFREAAREEMLFYSGQKTLMSAVSVSARGITKENVKHPHQYRIPKEVLKTAEQRLIGAINHFDEIDDFDKLHSIVSDLITPISGIGQLTVYDITQRIGAFLGVEPKVIYLHAGTRVGAKALGFSGNSVTKQELPAAFSRLSPGEIEDCLCIFKNSFGQNKTESTACLGNETVSSCLPKPSGGCGA